MKNVKLLLLLVLFGGWVMIVTASIVQEFTDGTTKGNFTFNGSESKYKNISIKKERIIKNATISLAGFGGYCFQDSANISNCEGLVTGNYSWFDPDSVMNNKEKAYDESISTGAEFTGFNKEATLFINYTKPDGTLNNSLWQVANEDVVTNLTLGACWEGYTNKLVFRVNTSCYGTIGCSNRQKWDCYNGTDWTNLLSDNGVIFVNEEAMYWEFFPTNLTVNINNTLIYQNLSNTSSNFNGSTIINFTDELNNQRKTCEFTDGINCNVSINFTSLTTGTLEYSNINLTQNDVPNATNVSITELPITQNNILKGHANYSDQDNDNPLTNETKWYVNRTEIFNANGSFTLLGGNVTDNTNITFSARFNDTYDWGDWVNSSTINVGDSVAPTLNNCTLSSTSITDASGNTINLTCDATDARSNIQTMVASLNGTINKTLTFSFTQSQNVIATRIIFQSEETLLVGSYSVNQVNVTDTSSNKLSNTTKDLHFTVTSAPSGSSNGGGGGGGTQATIIIEKNETIITGQCNFNGICEPQFGEDSFNCGVRIEGDCEPKFEEILPTCLLDKNQQCLWRTAIVGRIALIALIVSFLILISDTQQGRKVRKVLKERLNINLLKE